MDRDVALHFRDQLRDARAAVLRDAEAFQAIVVVIERLGMFLCGELGNLGQYATKIRTQAALSPMAEEIPALLPDFHRRFDKKYSLVRQGRNAAIHEGALARHLTVNAVEISLVLEEAIMSEHHQVCDFMVRNPVCASLWQPLSFVRQTMLVNSFSYLPVQRNGEAGWGLISDFGLARCLRNKGRVSKEVLIQRLEEAVDSGQIELLSATTCHPEDTVEKVLQMSDGLPTLVLSKDRNDLVGIVTPFDLL